jgi:hypothetical protein
LFTVASAAKRRNTVVKLHVEVCQTGHLDLEVLPDIVGCLGVAVENLPSDVACKIQ